MTAFRLERLVKRYGAVPVVDGVSLEIQPGEFITLLGPSGSGKTTTLRMIAGFIEPDEGAVILDGRDISRVPPHRRDIGMVFQSYALFPHMTATQNIAFPLKIRKVPKREIERRVAQVLELVDLPGLGGRYPRQLSGGQQQRVALARAVVFNPGVLLMDEPLGALDKKLREAMQLEISRISHEIGVSVIYVTHDQEEALAMSDRIAIFRDGRIDQLGTGEELYESPASLHVATFVGESTVFRGVLRVGADGPAIDSEHGRLAVSPSSFERAGLASGERAAVVIRPEWLDVEPADNEIDPSRNRTSTTGTLVEDYYLGPSRKLVVDVDSGTRAVARIPSGREVAGLSTGRRVRVSWELEHSVLVADEGADLPEGQEEGALEPVGEPALPTAGGGPRVFRRALAKGVSE